MALSKTLQKITAGVQKEYGESMANVAADATNRDIISYSTGSMMLDVAIGANRRAGFPEGRLIEVYGPQGAGKSTTALLAIAERQRIEQAKSEKDPDYTKKYCIFLDAENALDMNLAEEYGVDLTELIYIDPETAEQGLDVMIAYIETGEIGMAVIDSVPALVPSSIQQSSLEQQHMATLARFMSGVCQRLTGIASKHKTTIVFINQVREAIGKFSRNGTPEVTPGGRALKYYSSIRLSVRRGDTIKQGSDIVGQILA